MVLQALDIGVLYVFIVLDNPDSSIFNIKSAVTTRANGQIKVQIKAFMDDFPFAHYLVIESVNQLNSNLM